MDIHTERPPIAAAPISLILTCRHADAERGEALAEWVAFLDGLGQEYEILLVNETGGPATEELAARYAHMQALAPYGRSGFGAALRLGLAHARHPLLFYARCDRRYSPADLKKLLKWIDRVDLAAGERVFPPGHRRGWREFAYRLGYRIVSGVRLKDAECLFVLARRSIFSRLIIQSDSVFAHAEVLDKANFLGCLMTEVHVTYRPPAGPDVPPLSGDLRAIRADARRVYDDPEFAPPPVEAPPASEDAARP
jgi:hypothetical protein